jgi:hypothetical protein
VFQENGQPEVTVGSRLGAAWSRALFARSGKVLKIEVDITEHALR